MNVTGQSLGSRHELQSEFLVPANRELCRVNLSLVNLGAPGEGGGRGFIRFARRSPGCGVSAPR